MSFSVDLLKYAQKTKASMGEAKQAVVMSLFSAVIKSTPVDEGRAKANWFITENTPSSEMDTRTDKSRLGNLGMHSQRELEGVTGNFTLDIMTNNLPYIIPLERGHSTQAPVGMVALNVMKLATIARREGWK